MEHFNIVLALARMALNGDGQKVEHQLQRLQEVLDKADKDQSDKIKQLLQRNERRQEVAPMSLERMSAEKGATILPAQSPLTPSTPIPHDKETSAPLARIIFPQALEGKAPILSNALREALEDLLKEWENLRDLAALGVLPNTRCLLYGAPGVGKTLLARYIAYRLGLPIVEARLDGLVSSFLGTSARNIGALFDFVNRYKCVLFLDEFDALAKARDDAQEVGEIKRVVNTLLQSLDSRAGRGFTIAATNHEHLLDSAVWRRFESRIHILPPESDARMHMLSEFLKPIQLNDPEMRFLVWITENMSGADIETLVTGGKRYLALHAPKKNKADKETAVRGKQLLGALQRQAILNARFFSEEKKILLLGHLDALAQILWKEAGLTQIEAGELLGISQSSISRKNKTSEAVISNSEV